MGYYSAHRSTIGMARYAAKVAKAAHPHTPGEVPDTHAVLSGRLPEGSMLCSICQASSDYFGHSA